MMSKTISTIVILLMVLVILATPAAASQTSVNVNAPERVDGDFMDADTVRVLFKLSGDNGVSGSGYVTKIGFEITGSQGDTSIPDIFDGLLADNGADEIPATWTDDEVTV